ncbi:MAG: alpha/beta fold hydrolase [Actinomycetota bacterium]|nr:alpha/beta fold hydrolase [Actinomycetota bacterium]
MGVVEVPVVGQVDLGSLAVEDCVGLNLDGSLPPLVMVRTWFAEVPLYQRLARELGPDQPIYTLGHPTGDRDSDYPSDIEQWRDFCLARLGRLGLSDPLWLGGWSFGGVVALEMARSLQARGREVAQVVMLDSRMPKRKARRGMYDLQQIAVAVHEYTMFPTKQERSAYLRRRGGGQVSIYRKKLSSRFGRGAQQPSHSAERGGAPEASQKPADRLTRALYVCYLKYRTQKIDVPVTQLWTQESRAQVTGDLTLGWAQAFDGEFQAVGVPGGHRTMFDDENTAAVATRLKAALERARVPSQPF